MRVSASLVGLAMVLAGCGGGSTPATTSAGLAGPDTAGRALFEERVIGSSAGCATCHSLEPNVTIVGPSLAGVRSRIAGVSDADYVRESILDPSAYPVDGYAGDLMPTNMADYLTTEQIDSLVDFLLSDQ